jgi:hypothetical protein
VSGGGSLGQLSLARQVVVLVDADHERDTLGAVDAIRTDTRIAMATRSIGASLMNPKQLYGGEWLWEAERASLGLFA